MNMQNKNLHISTLNKITRPGLKFGTKFDSLGCLSDTGPTVVRLAFFVMTVCVLRALSMFHHSLLIDLVVSLW